jgi:uncharacterized protein YqgC (DUF456 family)
MEVGWFAAALGLILLGVIGCVLPVLPGLPLVLGGVFLYALGTRLEGGIGGIQLVVIGLVGGAAIGLSMLANVLGVRAAGGSRAAVVGAVLGLIVGLFVGGPIGLLVGPFVGAVLFELIGGRAARQALRSGTGAALGLLVGKVVELAVAIGFGAWFVATVIRA